LKFPNYRPLVLIILSLAVFLSVPGIKASLPLGNLVPPSFEVNAISVSQQGDIAAGSFYALDPTIVPWDLTNPIYKYVGVTLIVSNLNNTSLSGTTGVNITSAANTLAPYHVFLVIEGVQRNTIAIVSDIQTLFGIPGKSSFEALTSSPFTLPVSVFASNFTSYSSFVNRFVSLSSAKHAMIGQYTTSQLLQSSSGIMFNSLESLTYPVSSAFSLSGLGSAVLGVTAIGAAIAPAFGLNSTGVVVIHKKALSFNLAQDYTVSFDSLVGVSGGIYSTTNETFAVALPGGAQIRSFSPANMLVSSSVGSTLVVGVFPWVGTSQRLLPDVSVTFHYPAFNSPVLGASWTTTPSTPDVGQPFTLTLKVNNTGPVAATNLHFTFGFTGAVLSSKPNITSIQYGLNMLPAGGTNTTMWNFQSYNPDPSLTLSAVFLDTANFVYDWSTQGSLASNVKTNGPLKVTKSVSPANPSYGQIGNVTSFIQNTSSSTYYNVEDLSPEAQAFLYPHGFGVAPPQPKAPCPYVLPNNYNPNILANNTHFNFQVGNQQTNLGISCTPAVLSRVLIQHGIVPTTQVATPNQLIGQGEVWSRPNAYLIPGGALPGDLLVLTLTFLNYGNITVSGFVSNTGLLPQLENPKTSYLAVYCLPCSVFRNSTMTVAVGLFNATGSPIPGQTVSLSYQLGNNPPKPLGTLKTNATGGAQLIWNLVSAPAADYKLLANFAGNATTNPSSVFTAITILTPTTITPNGTMILTYPYIFNVTGTLTITRERIGYSSRQNATGISYPLMDEYITQSPSVSVTIGAPTIVPVVDESMTAPKISLLYVVQNQSLVQINLRVTNTGPQTANNVVVSSLIPQVPGSSILGTAIPHSLPVVSTGPFIVVSSNSRTVTFSPGMMAPGASSSSWYIVRANETNLFETANNVTAQAGGNNYLFYYTGPLLGVYPSTPLSSTLVKRGYLQAYATIDPAVVANNTATTVTLHLYNGGNVTYTNINATAAHSPGSQLVFTTPSVLLSNMAPGTSQTTTFTGTAAVSAFGFYNGVSTYPLQLAVSYKVSTAGFWSNVTQNVLIYNPAIPGFNPSLRVDVTTSTQAVTAGATALVNVTVTNTGSAPVTNIQTILSAYNPMFNPNGPSNALTSYGGYSNGWEYSLAPGQKLNFRIGIQTTAGGTYPVFAGPGSTIYYTYNNPTGSFSPTSIGFISLSSSVLITATDTAAPSASTPWSSPFAPTSSDQVRIWSQIYDGSGVASANLEYSTDRLSWTSIPMTRVFGSYLNGQVTKMQQPFFGDIYNVTLPPEGPGAAVFYRIRSTDNLGNTGLSDNYGNDYVYFIQGGNSWLFNQPPGTNMLLNGTRFVPGIITTVSLNVSTPIAVQVIQLGMNPGGAPPSGMKPLGVYTQINTNLTITLNARLRFYYTSAQIHGLDPNTVTPYYWDGTKWTALTGVTRNNGQNYVEASVTHFSLFGLFANTLATQPPTSPTFQLPWLIIGVVAAVALVAVIGGILAKKRRKRGTQSLLQSPPSPPTPASTPGTLSIP
jgi:hypothetical protein